MPNNDISDLHGIYPASLRWSAENGILGVAAYDQDTGERDRERISCFAMRAPTVMPPKQLTTELSRALLGTGTPEGKRRRAPKLGSLEEMLDDEVPNLAR